MGIDLQTVLAAITGGAQGLATANQQDQARKRQMALEAMNAAVHKDAMAKQVSDTQRQQGEDYLKGIRPGTAPNAGALNAGLDIAASAAGQGPGAAGLSTPIAIQAMRSADPTRYAPDRFQQVTPNSYADKFAMPEAVHERGQKNAAVEAMRRAVLLQENKPDRY